MARPSRETKMKWLALIAAAGVACAAQAQEKVVLGMSGWTGFQPLKLAELAGIFKKNGVDIETRFIAPVQRSAALASGALNAAATTVDQHIVWSSAGIPTVQVALIVKKDFIEKHPKIVKATVDSFFEALDMIKREPDKAYELMGSVVKQPGDAFAKSAAYIAWQDRAANKGYYAKDHKAFVDFAVRVLKSNRVIEKQPKAEEMVDLRFQ